MRLTVSIDGHSYSVDLSEAVDVGIYQHFDGSGPALFGGRGPSRETYSSGAFVGSTNRGGSCNVDKLTLTPHLDGTHTETVAHITDGVPNIGDANLAPLMPSTLVTTATTAARDTTDSVPPTHHPDDRVITKDDIGAAFASARQGFCEAALIRTLPNEADKTTRNYDRETPPYFSIEAVTSLLELGVNHLLVDLPSIDRTDDGGRLACHHKFFESDAPSPPARTVTELIFVPDSIPDGAYLLSLQYPRMATDAAPSRPVLVPVRALAGHV